MSAILYGVPGKLKTMIDRLTSARAAKIDNLDAAVTTRAPASTALSNSVWSDGRAGKLDDVLLNSDPLVAAPIAYIPSDPSATPDATSDYLSVVGGLANGKTASTSYVDIVNYTGQGVIEFCALVSSGTDVSMQLIIDGVTVGSCSVDAGSGYWRGKSLVGVFASGSVASISLGQVPFYTSLVIKAKVTSSGTANIYYKYRKTA